MGCITQWFPSSRVLAVCVLRYNISPPPSPSTMATNDNTVSNFSPANTTLYKRIICNEEQIAKRVNEMAQDINQHYQGKEIILIGTCVLLLFRVNSSYFELFYLLTSSSLSNAVSCLSGVLKGAFLFMVSG